jgi:hypothetical protein
MPIRIHVSQLSEEARLAKLGVKRRAKLRKLERQHQVALIKWVRSERPALDAHGIVRVCFSRITFRFSGGDMPSAGTGC